MGTCPCILVIGFALALSASAWADPSDVEKGVLSNRLDNLESQAIQRRGRAPTVLDLLKRQDDRLAGRQLNTLKTRNPRSTVLPLLERQLDRSRR